jgi:hypothetical protein
MIADRRRIPGEMLTDEEIANLRRDLEESAAYVRVYFRARSRGKLDDRSRDCRPS